MGGAQKITVKLENFLKHAEHDPNPSAKITFSTERTEFYILDGIFLWHMIEGGKHPLFEAFCAWFFLSRPAFFKDTFNTLFKIGIIEPNLSRPEFLAKYLKEHVKPAA
jgi:hypothetical protein